MTAATLEITATAMEGIAFFIVYMFKQMYRIDLGDENSLPR